MQGRLGRSRHGRVFANQHPAPFTIALNVGNLEEQGKRELLGDCVRRTRQAADVFDEWNGRGRSSL